MVKAIELVECIKLTACWILIPLHVCIWGVCSKSAFAAVCALQLALPASYNLHECLPRETWPPNAHEGNWPKAPVLPDAAEARGHFCINFNQAAAVMSVTKTLPLACRIKSSIRKVLLV